MASLTSTRFLSLSSLFATALIAGPLSAPAGGQGLGTNYCTGAPNSTGSGAVMDASGSQDVGHNNLTLSAGPAPIGETAIFFYGQNQNSVPLGDGIRCIGPGNFRIMPPVLVVDNGSGTGFMSTVVDLASPPAVAGTIADGSTWNFQAWYRDLAAQGAGHNLSDGYEITFAPVGGAYDGMALVPAGSFEMGRHVGSGGSDEVPIHTVNLDAFYMDIHEVTILEYADYLNNALARGEVAVDGSGGVVQVGGAGEELCGTSTSSFSNHLDWDGTSFSADPSHPVAGSWAEHPMVMVGWYGACAYANGKSRDAGLDPCYDESDWSCDFTQNGYRLPTEAEWEYAARGGEHSPYYRHPWGDSIDGSQANYWLSGDPYDGLWSSQLTLESTPVGYYDGSQIPAGVDMANGYGLYDMSGNVWEWCWDWYDSNYYSSSPTDNPTGPATGADRVIRGPSWNDSWLSQRSANRNYVTPGSYGVLIGVRVLAVRP